MNTIITKITSTGKTHYTGLTADQLLKNLRKQLKFKKGKLNHVKTNNEETGKQHQR